MLIKNTDNTGQSYVKETFDCKRFSDQLHLSTGYVSEWQAVQGNLVQPIQCTLIVTECVPDLSHHHQDLLLHLQLMHTIKKHTRISPMKMKEGCQNTAYSSIMISNYTGVTFDRSILPKVFWHKASRNVILVSK